MSDQTQNREEPRLPQRGGRLFQIHEDDLMDLERILPNLADALMPHLDTGLRVQIRRIKAILSNVRWDYGPPSEVIVIPADGP